jgi:type I site-specific restriction endonuclease
VLISSRVVDYDLYVARTRFQRKGIKGADLTEEERNALIEQGRDPDDIDYSGTDIERKVSNRDALRQQWEEFWEVCHKDESGQLPGKTIVFAMTQEHTLRLADAFEEMFPQYPGFINFLGNVLSLQDYWNNNGGPQTHSFAYDALYRLT